MEKYYRCTDCGNEFEYTGVEKKPCEYTTYSEIECPNCHSVEVDEGYQCQICGAWIEKEALPEVYLCKSCLARETKKVQTVLQAVRNSLSEIGQDIFDNLIESEEQQ